MRATPVFLCATLLTTAAAAQDSQKTVLTLYPTRLNAPAAVALDRTVEQALGRGLGGKLDYYTEHIDLARFSEPGYQPALRAFLRTKYERHHPDLIVAVLDEVLEFLAPNRDDLFPGVPIVFYSTGLVDAGPLATGVRSTTDYASTLDVALRLQPDTQRVVVVSGASVWDKSYEMAARQQFKKFEDRLAFTYYSGRPMPELLRQVASLPAGTIVYYLSVTEDGDGIRGLPVDALDRLAGVASVPIYCWHTVAMGHGIVGGSLQSAERQAQGIAAPALRVLAGERPDAIPVADINLNAIQFDWRQLRRWRIDESRLPPGSEVLFRMPRLWEQYRTYFLIGGLLLTLQTLTIVTLLFQRARRLHEIAERKRVEDTLLENEAVLRASHEEVRHLAGRLITAQEHERTRIARELHDDVSQQLAGLSIALSGLRKRGDGVGDFQGAVTSIQQRTIALAESVRHLSHDLHPGVLQHAGLVSVLAAHCAELQGHESARLTFDAADEFASIDPDAALCLYRVAQEALRNAFKHAGARRIDVRLIRAGDDAELTIADDGTGFDAVRTRRTTGGLGLLSIIERARLVGGTVSIVTELNKGTRVQVRIPVNRDVDAGIARDQQQAAV
jgi:signal transduction histidine kinase